MYKKIAGLMTLVLMGNICAVAQNKTAGGMLTNKQVQHHVVIQLTSSDTLVWKGLMNNVKHLQDEWPGNVQVEVVAHGPGIEMMMISKTTQQNRIAELKKAGAVFAVCENTLKARELKKDAIIPEAVFVHSGVVEVVTKQEEGWSYLKTGF